MQTLQTQTLSRFALVGNSVIDRLLAPFVTMLGRGGRGRQDVTPGYEGYGWCDSLEQQVNSDIAICRHARFRGCGGGFPFGSN